MDGEQTQRQLATGLGVLVRRWVDDSPLSVHQVRRRVRSERLPKLTRGAYLPSEVPRLPEHSWFAALLRAGPDALLTGEVACALLGLTRARRGAPLQVLVRSAAVRGGVPGVVRTSRFPQGCLARPREGDLAWPVAPLPRALADAVLRTDVEHARELVGEALHGGRLLGRQLRHELRASRQRSVAQRQVLADLDAGGVWSVAEGDWIDLVRTSSVLPPPQLNVLLVDGRERPVSRPDTLWWEAALAGSVDSRENHGDVQKWARTLEGALETELRGLLTMHLPPAGISTRPHDYLLVAERRWTARYGCPEPEDLFRRYDVAAPLRSSPRTTP